ncbi:polysaccharide biosynthesis protein [Marinobacter lacisalsi]|uniref:Polysaccharide biosynthesis protein n=1 Tax=Marinobacter lacisalsi TaxID=475979 RepID=A0ABV8QIE9_9GAMM
MLKVFLNFSRLQKRLISVVSDAVFLSFSFWAAFALRLEDKSWTPAPDQLLVGLITVGVSIVIFARLGLYRAIIRYLSDKAFLTVSIGVGSSALTIIALAYLLQAFVPRSVPIIYAALAFLFVSGSRMGVRMLVGRPRHRNKEPVAIIGTGETGIHLADALLQDMQYEPVMFVTYRRANHRTLIQGIPVYDIDHIEKAIRKHGVKRLLLALDPDTHLNRKQLLRELEQLEVPVQTVPSMAELVSGRARINDIRDLEIEDLLGREPVSSDNALVAASLFEKCVFVTGAGGSIGSELCRQILRQRPSKLVLFDQSEYALYAIERELQSINNIEGLGVELSAILGSAMHRRRCAAVMRAFGIHTVYHAAAYKHVPLVEHNLIEGVQNNTFGTWHVAEAAIETGVERFVLISTDKAVRPTNIMGASKRLAELVLQGLAERQTDTRFTMVRFGNVLGSSGSVVPLFRDQIRDGGPVTVTHPDIIRYFMTIPEASQLVLQAGSMGQGGEVFVLDMGEPVKIVDLARKMVHLMGLSEKTEDNPDGDIEVRFTGLRPGEKLFEELLIGDNPQGTNHPRIMMAREASMPWEDVESLLKKLLLASQNFDCARIADLIREAPTGYAPNGEVADLVWCHSAPLEDNSDSGVRRLGA